MQRIIAKPLDENRPTATTSHLNGPVFFFQSYHTAIANISNTTSGQFMCSNSLLSNFHPTAKCSLRHNYRYFILIPSSSWPMPTFSNKVYISCGEAMFLPVWLRPTKHTLCR